MTISIAAAIVVGTVAGKIFNSIVNRLVEE